MKVEKYFEIQMPRDVVLWTNSTTFYCVNLWVVVSRYSLSVVILEAQEKIEICRIQDDLEGFRVTTLKISR
jgi:hypothetical protein